jgi:serine/threonine protein kinase/tetratricopeptide (TPR) repeat protein
MGEVYLAEDTRLERRVALKIMPAELVKDDRRLSRFEQEARAVSALNHPNIITLHEIGQNEAAHFIVTEFVEGETLRRRMVRSRLELLEVLDIATQIASALVASHEAGIIHRDIKPDNIMLRPDGYVKVLDFGIAKLKETFSPQTTVRIESENTTIRTPVTTEPGIIIGSPNYMSPEQARGLAVDERSDIFSLGVMIYEMVIGKRPFQGATVTDLIVAILTQEAKPVSETLPEAPEKLDRILKKALAKKLDQRYQSMKEMLIDLKRLKHRLEFEAGLDVSTPPEASESPDNPVPQSVKTATGADKKTLEMTTTGILSGGRTTLLDAETLADTRKQRRLVLFALLTLMLIIATATAIYLLRSRPRSIDSLAVLPFINVSGDANTEYLSDGLTESLINSLSRLPNLKVMSRNSVFQYKGKELVAKDLGKALSVRAILTGHVTQSNDSLLITIELIDAKDDTQIWGERYVRRMADLATVEQEISSQLSEMLKPQLTTDEKRRLAKSNTKNAEAYQLYLRGRYHWNKRTSEAMNRGIEYFKQTIEKDPQYALAYAGLADCYALLGEYGKLPMKESLPLAKEAAQKAIALDPSLAEAHTSLAAVHEYEWDWTGAEKEYRLAIEMNPNYATAHHWYGILLSSLTRFAEAEPELRKALELDPLSLIINTGLGRMFCGARRYDEAIEQLTKTLEIEPNFAEAHFQLALAYEGKQLYAQSAEAFQKSVELFDDPTMKGWVAREYALSNRKEEARKMLDELKSLSRQQYVSPYMIAIGYAALNEREQAYEWLSKVADEKSYYVVWLKVDPVWDAFRTEARFQDILRRIGLPQ